ncbi:AraC family transcriptional regulator [Vallitalea longa]|uniref:AraC family transcriptional regulator n=1 Tax=Vallitalea longa TaxID=2936439 RepID=A0A9W5YCI9_9FIRM|nr:AraC family transcriptional regulator [Vallitalea longa]GKX31477.1 AraC family transcriptional regulator [Vallitalea longa]
MKNNYSEQKIKKVHFRKGQNFYINRNLESVKSHYHLHDGIEIAYVVEGTGFHRINDQLIEVTKGDLFIINSHTPHEFCYNKKVKYSPLIIYNCLFKDNFIDDKLNGKNNLSYFRNNYLLKELFPDNHPNEIIRVAEDGNSNIEEIFDKMLREYLTGEPGYVQMLRVYIVELLVIIFRLYKYKEEPKNYVDEKNKNIISRVINYIEINYSCHITLTNMAKTYGYTPDYFSKLFKKTVGISLINYVQKIRIKEACKLLKSPNDYKVIEIANKVGYKDIKFFNYIFKKIVGMTPSKYRKK